MRVLRYAVLLGLFAIASGLSAAPGLTPFSAHYAVYADGFKIGEMDRVLSRLEGSNYILETKLYTTGLVALFKADTMHERSTWSLEGDTPVPHAYVYRYTGRSGEIIERLDFDWSKGRVESLRDGKVTELPLQPGVLDKLMYQVALRRDLARGEREIAYRVADRGRIEEYRFEVKGRERLQTELGELETLRVARGTTTFWVAVDLDYLLVKLPKDENGHELASYIVSYRQR